MRGKKQAPVGTPPWAGGDRQGAAEGRRTARSRSPEGGRAAHRPCHASDTPHGCHHKTPGAWDQGASLKQGGRENWAYGSSQATVHIAKETLTGDVETRRQLQGRARPSDSVHGEPTLPCSPSPCDELACCLTRSPNSARRRNGSITAFHVGVHISVLSPCKKKSLKGQAEYLNLLTNGQQ